MATYHAEATVAAVDVLERGGNAVDAFITATLVEYVLAPGVTSIAGPLVALVHDAERREFWHLDADFNSPLLPAATAEGRAFVVPGAASGLRALWMRYGSLPFEELAAPAIRIAEDGFAIDATYAAMVAWRRDVLARTEYGRQLFVPGGEPIGEGTLLRQPALAELLRRLSTHGTEYIEGEWGTRVVDTVAPLGSRLSAADFARYEARWLEPHSTNYRGRTVFAPAGRTFGGLWGLFALEVLEHTAVPERTADELELLVRIARATHEERWFYDLTVLDDPSRVMTMLGDARTRAAWERVSAQLDEPSSARPGSHSYHVTVVDARGNAITGTHTITSMPWGDGYFVQGAPLSAAGHLGYPSTPGDRIASGMSMHLVAEDGELRAAMGTFSTSLLEAGLQLVVNVVDHEVAAEGAVARPRFGTFVWDDTMTQVDLTTNWLDPGVPADVVAELAQRGVMVVQQGAGLDTGLGTAIIVGPSGATSAGFAPRLDLGGSAVIIARP